MGYSQASESASTRYRLKLSSGRILGPLDRTRIAALLKKKRLNGGELVKLMPEGNWKPILEYDELADLFVGQLQGNDLTPMPGTVLLAPSRRTRQIHPSLPTVVLPAPSLLQSLRAAIRPNPERAANRRSAVLPDRAKPAIRLVDQSPLSPTGAASQTVPLLPAESQKQKNDARDDIDLTNLLMPPPEAAVDPEFTLGTQVALNAAADASDPALRQVASVEEPSITMTNALVLAANAQGGWLNQAAKILAQQETVSFERPNQRGRKQGKSLVPIIAVAFLGYLAFDTIFPDAPDTPPLRSAIIRPRLPDASPRNPKQSLAIYQQALVPYLKDTMEDYRSAAELFRQAAALDMSNVKALALLASCYLQLIDVSNKDEKYFFVISKLIDLSRASGVDLAETMIADVEFFLTVQKPQAAQSRIVEFTRAHTYGIELFFYLAETFWAAGDVGAAARYLGQIPKDQAKLVRVAYLRGLIAEKLGDALEAGRNYAQALSFSPNHARSHLRLASLLNQSGHLRDAQKHLSFLVEHPQLLTPSELAESYYLHGQLSELLRKWDLALGDLEKAVDLNPTQSDYLLELYTLRAKAGDNLTRAQKQARMYYYLSEGEKFVRLGRYQDALIPFLQARQANDASALPLVKAGDMFSYLHDAANTLTNYKLAVDRDPKNKEVLSKYIKTLLQSFEWEEASKNILRLSTLPNTQSIQEKFQADKFAKQGLHQDAQVLYRSAMSFDAIDPEVYLAYAQSLMATKNFKDASFFFALARRYDPLNMEPVIGIAQCVAESESIERAVANLQEELGRAPGQKAEYLTAIANLQIQKGDYEQAQLSVTQAMKENPSLADPWKLQARIHLNAEHVDKNALTLALEAFKSYSERNASDPSGYLERYFIFAKQLKFDLSKKELDQIYTLYPKYPKLHYYMGALYALEGNHQAAVQEFAVELKNNSGSLQTQIAYGRELIELTRYEEAATVLATAMRNEPNSAEVKQLAGWTSYLLKSYPPAAALLASAAQLDPGNPIIYKRLGFTHQAMGDTGRPASISKSILRWSPTLQTVRILPLVSRAPWSPRVRSEGHHVGSALLRHRHRADPALPRPSGSGSVHSAPAA